MTDAETTDGQTIGRPRSEPPGLDLVEFQVADVPAFEPDRPFQAAITMHVVMNVQDKAAWFPQIARWRAGRRGLNLATPVVVLAIMPTWTRSRWWSPITSARPCGSATCS